jgi:hypothetical protein
VSHSGADDAGVVVFLRWCDDILFTYSKEQKMEINYVDIHTFGHLGGGILSCVLLQYSNVPIVTNFILANGIHYCSERNEKSVAPNGSVLETNENHIGDIIAFLLGWIVAYVLRLERYVTSKIAPILWFVLLFFTALEFLREIYPYERLLVGAYTLDK